MILDRGLTPELCEVALRVATSGEPFAQQRKLLTIALRDHVSAQEAQGKTKKCLTRVWVNPPPEAAPMIRWAADHAHLAADRRVLHLGALLATFPLVGTVAAIIGRGFAMDGYVDPIEVRHRTAKVWGDKSSIDVGARKAYTTLRHFGMVVAEGRALRPGQVVEVPAPLVAWLVHAVLASRSAEGVSEPDLAAAPELFWAQLGRPTGRYPLLVRHQEGGGRAVWAAP